MVVGSKEEKYEAVEGKFDEVVREKEADKKGFHQKD
jgi:hypothetical protein